MDESMPWSKRVQKQGWLQKRGQHIKNWRPRFFVLLHNGTLLGYKEYPENLKAFNNPLNRFQVSNCTIVNLNKASNLHPFILSRLNNDETLERIFSAHTEEEKREWIKAIEAVSRNTTDSSDSVDPPFHNDPRRKRNLNDFEFLCVLGKGTFGKVILSKDKITGQPCALKVLRKDMVISRDEVEHTMNENHVLRRAKHPFITDLLWAFTTAEYLCFAMEYVGGGELFYHLTRARRFDIEQAKFYMAEIACALGYLHRLQVIYRDLKLENVLLDFEGHVRLVDFGLCNVGRAATDTFCGTPEYIAPEIIRAERYTKAVDWWSLGVVAYEMLEGRLPFSASSGASVGTQTNYHAWSLFKDISSAPLPETQIVTDPASTSLLHGLLCKDPEKRIGSSADDYLELERHAFFRCPEPQPSFDDYERKKVTPPFVPMLRSQADTSYFEAEFTSQPARLTESSLRSDAKSVALPNCFDKFTYLGSQSSLMQSSLASCSKASVAASRSSITADSKKGTHENLNFIDTLFQNDPDSMFKNSDTYSLSGSILFDTASEPQSKVRKVETSNESLSRQSDADMALCS